MIVLTGDTNEGSLLSGIGYMSTQYPVKEEVSK